MEITADYAKYLTKVINEVNENVSNCEFQWVPIMFAIKRGYNWVAMNVSSDDEMEFVNKLKELGYKVKIEEKRFYNQAVIEW
jgi:cobalamin biosynthesis Co2+ chelatase CbiK